MSLDNIYPDLLPSHFVFNRKGMSVMVLPQVATLMYRLSEFKTVLKV